MDLLGESSTICITEYGGVNFARIKIAECKPQVQSHNVQTHFHCAVHLKSWKYSDNYEGCLIANSIISKYMALHRKLQ